MVQCKHTTYAWPELHGHLLLSNSHTGSCSVLWPFPFCGGGFVFTPKPAHDMCHVEVWPNCLKACEEEQRKASPLNAATGLCKIGLTFCTRSDLYCPNTRRRAINPC